MRDRELVETRKRQIRYGALAVAVVVLAAGLVFLAYQVDPTTASAPAENAAAGTAARDARRVAVGASTSPATTPAAAASTRGATSGDEVTVVNGLRRDEAVALIGDARRQAAAGNYTEAEASLAKAEKAAPKLAETQQARDDIARLKTPEGQFANHIQRARLAVDHDDSAAAEAELAEAARLKSDAPEIAELRAALQAAHDKKARREARIADVLARMREAMARRDFSAANSALNEAERIDVQEPAIRRGRGGRARGQDKPPQKAYL
jgi:hypothetical protein